MARWATQFQADLPMYSCPADIKNPAKALDNTLLSGPYPKVLKAGPSRKKVNQWEDLSDLEDMDTMEQWVRGQTSVESQAQLEEIPIAQDEQNLYDQAYISQYMDAQGAKKKDEEQAAGKPSHTMVETPQELAARLAEEDKEIQ
uniref:Uncharacterized protein n=1 Tax=Romanomermis culicivorax TaxID=13658 RepID=A0A915IMH2_ROMCU